MDEQNMNQGASLRDRAFVNRAKQVVSALRASIPSAWWALRRFDLPYWFRSRFVPSCRFHVVNTGLSPGWHDVDERILYACMALLCSYVEDEQGGEVGFPGFAVGTPEADAEALTIYRWWRHQRSADREREGALLMAWYSASPRTEEAFRAAIDAEAENDARDQEMLHRLIDIRRSLWT